MRDEDDIDIMMEESLDAGAEELWHEGVKKELLRQKMNDKGMYEVVEYRTSYCGYEFCHGERITVLFNHKDKPQCINFMLRFPETINAYTELIMFKDNKDKIAIKFHLLNGMVGIRKLRVQKVEPKDAT